MSLTVDRSEISIRAFQLADRDAIRAISFATGFMGETVGWLWPDSESFADLTNNYYIEREAESLFVAERDGVVVGYLMGCADSERGRGAMAREVRRLLLRGYLLRPGAAAFLWRSAFDIVRDRGAADEVLGDAHWPAHLHINLLPEGRGLGLGRRLVDAWLARLDSAGVPGIHLGTFAENYSAIRFFESCGFARHGVAILVPGFRTRLGARMHSQWMVRSLAGAPPLSFKT